MSDRTALVLGSTGMLGSAIVGGLRDTRIKTLESSRTSGLRFEFLENDLGELLDSASLNHGDFVINCLGLTKTHIHARDRGSVELAIGLNSLFPHRLVEICEQRGYKVIQVATDCVFSGLVGPYFEDSPHDALDIYGKTKSLGEVLSPNLMLLRCSLIGPERPGRNTLFFEWVRNLDFGAQVSGFVNHKWNGVTSDTFARIVSGIIREECFRAGVQHLVPFDAMSKYDLIALQLSLLGRTDVKLEPVESVDEVDRTLSTRFPSENVNLFRGGGFSHIPSIREMMELLPWESYSKR